MWKWFSQYHHQHGRWPVLVPDFIVSSVILCLRYQRLSQYKNDSLIVKDNTFELSEYSGILHQGEDTTVTFRTNRRRNHFYSLRRQCNPLPPSTPSASTSPSPVIITRIKKIKESMKDVFDDCLSACLHMIPLLFLAYIFSWEKMWLWDWEP